MVNELLMYWEWSDDSLTHLPTYHILPLSLSRSVPLRTPFALCGIAFLYIWVRFAFSSWS